MDNKQLHKDYEKLKNLNKSMGKKIVSFTTFKLMVYRHNREEYIKNCEHLKPENFKIIGKRNV
jgi:hypothetical protein